MPESPVALTKARREILRALADIIVPRTDSMPSASDIDLAGMPVERALSSRPDLVLPLSALLDQLGAVHPEQAVARLASEDRGAFMLLMQVVAGAYYMDPRVRASLGYDGQRRLPIDPPAV